MLLSLNARERVRDACFYAFVDGGPGALPTTSRKQTNTRKLEVWKPEIPISDKLRPITASGDVAGMPDGQPKPSVRIPTPLRD